MTDKGKLNHLRDLLHESCTGSDSMVPIGLITLISALIDEVERLENAKVGWNAIRNPEA